MEWTDEQIERLKALWAEGLWASDIARAFGNTTKNAILGKVHRLGLPQCRAAYSQHRGPSAKDRRPERPKKPERKVVLLPKLPLPPPPEPWDGPSISMLDDNLSHFMCREIVAGSGVDTMFCGAPTVPGSKFSYCCFHAARNLNQEPKRVRKPSFAPYRLAA